MHDDISRERTTAVTQRLYVDYLTPLTEVGIGAPNHDTQEMWSTIPKFNDYFFYNEFVTGADTKNVQKNFDLGLAEKYYEFSDPGTMVVQRAMGESIRSTEDPDGVFPGNDFDNDGIADNNKKTTTQSLTMMNRF